MVLSTKFNNLAFLSTDQISFYIKNYAINFINKNSLQSFVKTRLALINFNLYYFIGFTYRMSLNSIIYFLKNSLFFKYNVIVDIAVLDFPGRLLRFQVNYLLLSTQYNTRLMLSVYTKEIFPIESLRNIFKGATWLEREVYDLYGILFYNQPDLRRILTDYAFKGFPLRKDFPLTGFNEICYNDIIKTISKIKVTLAQEYRVYTFQNPWVTLGKFLG